MNRNPRQAVTGCWRTKMVAWIKWKQLAPPREPDPVRWHLRLGDRIDRVLGSTSRKMAG